MSRTIVVLGMNLVVDSHGVPVFSSVPGIQQ